VATRWWRTWHLARWPTPRGGRTGVSGERPSGRED